MKINEKTTKRIFKNIKFKINALFGQRIIKGYLFSKGSEQVVH